MLNAAQHAILADSYRLKDLNSINGTQVNVSPDVRPSSKLKLRAGRKHVFSSLFYGNGGTKFSKRLNREHARQPRLEQKQATDALSSLGSHCASQMPNDSGQSYYDSAFIGFSPGGRAD
jgi:hypothetical protein